MPKLSTLGHVTKDEWHVHVFHNIYNSYIGSHFEMIGHGGISFEMVTDINWFCNAHHYIFGVCIEENVHTYTIMLVVG